MDWISRLTGVVKSFAEVFSTLTQQTKTTVNIPNIVVDTRVETKYRSGVKTRYAPITEVVIHGTAGGSSAEALINWMLNGERQNDYMSGIGLFHYAIDREGIVHTIIDPKGWVWHSSSGAHDQYTIGIELMNPSTSNATPYSDAQYSALAQLIGNVLKPKYTEIKTLVAHNLNQLTYSPALGGKQCPGPGFSWDKFRQVLTNEGVMIKTYAPEKIVIG